MTRNPADLLEHKRHNRCKTGTTLQTTRRCPKGASGLPDTSRSGTKSTHFPCPDGSPQALHCLTTPPGGGQTGGTCLAQLRLACSW